MEVRLNDNYTLVAEKFADPSYPGISIYLRTKDGVCIDIVYAEMKVDENDKVSVYTYENVSSDEFTRRFDIPFKDVEEALGE